MKTHVLLRPILWLMIMGWLGTAQVAKGQLATNYQWATGAGSSSFDRGQGIAVDASCNVYTIGWFTGTATFQTLPTSQSLTSVGDRDVFVTKQDRNGIFQWAKKFGGSGLDEGYGIAISPDGKVFITGKVTGNIFTTGTTFAKTDIFIARLSPSDGSVIWDEQIGTGENYDDVGFGIAANNTHVYTTGLRGILASSGVDIYVSQLDAVTGNIIWTQTLGGNYNDFGRAIAIDGSGNAYITGTFTGSGTFGCSACTLTAFGIDDAFVCKLNNNGVGQWAKRMGANTHSGETGYGIALDNSGTNVFVAGRYYGNFGTNGAKFDGTTPNNPYFVAGNTVASYVSKWNANTGNFEWAKNFTGGSNTLVTHLKLDAADNIYSVGAASGSAQFNPNFPASGQSHTLGGNGTYVSILSESGDYLNSFGFTSGAVWGIAVEGPVGQTNIYTTGNADGPGDFDPNPGTPKPLNAGSNNGDIFISKLGPCKAPTISGPTSFCADTRVTLTATGGNGTTIEWLLNNVVISGANSTTYSPTIAGSYSARYISNPCCTSAVSNVIPVTVTPLPATPTLTASPTTICSGDLVTLTGNCSSGATLHWLPTNPSLNPINTSLIPITVEYSAQCILNGCTSTVAKVPVIVQPRPDKPVIRSCNAPICNGTTAILLAPPGLRYTWYNNATGTPPAMTVDGVGTGLNQDSRAIEVLAGTYTVRTSYQGLDCLSPSPACTSLVSDPVVVTPCGGRQGEEEGQNLELPKEEQIKVYPNPTTSVLNLQLNGDAQRQATVQITDLLGKQVYKGKISGNNTQTIDLKGFGRGLYNVHVIIGDKVVTKQVVLE